MNNIREIIIGVLLVVVVYFVYRTLKTPPSYFDERGIIREKEAIIARQEAERRLLMDSVQHLRILGDTWYSEAMKERAKKTVVVTRWIKQNEKIDSLHADSLQSVFDRKYGASDPD